MPVIRITQNLSFLKFTCSRKFPRFRKTNQVVWKETWDVRLADISSHSLQTWRAAIKDGGGQSLMVMYIMIGPTANSGPSEILAGLVALWHCF